MSDPEGNPPQKSELPKSPEELEALLKTAKMDGFKLAAQTANHLLNTRLGVPLAFSEMASTSTGIPDNLTSLAKLSFQEIQKSAEILQKLLAVKKLVPQAGYPDILDLEKSLQPENPTSNY